MRVTSFIPAILLLASTKAFEDGVDVEFELFLTQETFNPVIIVNFPFGKTLEIGKGIFNDILVRNIKSVLVARSTQGRKYDGETCDFWDGDRIVAQGVVNDKMIIGISLGETVNKVNCTA